MSLLSIDVFRLPTIRAQLRSLPANEKTKLQQLAAADEQGWLYILENSGEQFRVESKQQVFQKEISFLDTTLSQNERDRLLVSAGSVVQGVTRKLRSYFQYDTNFADKVRFALLESDQFITIGEFIVNVYAYQNERVSRQLAYFTSPHRINCFQAHYLTTKLHLILGCQDSCLRVIERDQLLYAVQLESPVVCLHNFAPNYKEMQSPSKQNQRRCIVAGLEDGTIIGADLGSERSTVLFTFKISSVSCLKPFDFYRTGATDLVVATTEGVVEIYEIGQVPELKASKKLNEGIISIEVGNFQTPDTPEIVLSTFSGRIVLLKEGLPQIVQKEEKKTVKELQQKQKQLKTEVDELAQQLEKCKKSNQVTTKYKLQHKLLNNDASGMLKVVIDCQYPIMWVTLSSQLPLEKCCYQGKESRNLNINIKCQEGAYGQITCIVIPKDLSISQSFQIEVKPLMMYQSINPMKIKAPLSSLTLKGNFTKVDMSLWVNLMAEVSSVQEDDTVHFLLRNPLTDTYVQIKFKQESAQFKSDSVLAIYTIKEFIGNQANSRSIKMDVKCDCNDESVRSYIGKLKELQDVYSKLKRYNEITPAIKEVLIEFPMDVLSKEFRQLIENETELEKEYQTVNEKLSYLEELVVGTFKARSNLKKGQGLQPESTAQVKSLWQQQKINELIQYIIK